MHRNHQHLTPISPTRQRVQQRSEQDVEYLVANALGWYFWNLRLLDRGDAGDEVHVRRLPDLRTFYDLPAEVEDNEERDVDVCGMTGVSSLHVGGILEMTDSA